MRRVYRRLEYEDRGDGEVVYLVHAGVHSGWFTPLFDERDLDGFRVIKVVRPGYGRSEAATDHSFAGQARACGRPQAGADRPRPAGVTATVMG
jgi:pimeloyl-ACP methyl ester carboxylesterase